MKKPWQRILTACTSAAAIFTMGMAVSAAPVTEATIDTSRTGSLNIYKYDLTAAERDNVWTSGSYISTGVYDQTGVNDVLGNPNDPHTLPNGDTAYGYAVKGVEFTYKKVADIATYSAAGQISVLYGFVADEGETMLNALGLRFENRVKAADKLVNDRLMYYFTSDSLYAALADKTAENPTALKNAMEAYVQANGGTALPLTDGYGHTSATDLPLGLYLIVESKVPEFITATTTPFFVSLPMTAVNGTNAVDGGTRWLYDVTVYPKNASGMPTLDKTVREAKADTGKNNGTTADITDGYASAATGSGGDMMEYQILSTLPPITSAASYLTAYTYTDTLSSGLTYRRNDVVVEFFRDAACTDKITTWQETDETPKFTVTYAGNTMTVAMTAAGLDEINTADTVYTNAADSGYSSCTMRVTYAAAVNSDATLTYGDNGNANEVVLTWERTSAGYTDTLKDDCHVYTYGMELTKVFSDAKGDFGQVNFALYNDTDGYFVRAQRIDGVYYVTGHTTAEAEATVFVPTADGKITVKGLEDDTYTLTETATADRYQLLKDSITLVITVAEGETVCPICLTKRLVSCATVDGQAVAMAEDNGSASALVPLTVINYTETVIPETGEAGAALLVAGGVMAVSAALILLVFALRRKRQPENT